MMDNPAVSTSNIINKILKSPIRIDRIDVREYDRRGGGNPEPNTVSLQHAFHSIGISFFFSIGIVCCINIF